jgi:pyridoxal phosphate-dependent aminotransferase EpsN
MLFGPTPSLPHRDGPHLMGNAQKQRILLSIPHMGGAEQGYANEAFTLNWVSTVGPNITAFEEAFAQRIGRHSACLNSGTAAIHLGLRLLGVGPGDEVFCPTLTFAASANPIRYLGAEPVFIDSERRTWGMDPELLRRALRERAEQGRPPKVVIVVHLYGQCAEMEPIMEAAAEFGVPVFEDAAEALGASYRGQAAGTFGKLAAFSFNGNKIITTAGGGMLVSAEKALVDKARFWATQARDPGIAYEHSEMGYNYRMSNVLAGIGRGQLEVLDLRVEQRRTIASRYEGGFRKLPGIEPMPRAANAFSTNWLSCFLIRAEEFGVSRDELIRRLDIAGIESRPVWKPMHLQPLFANCETWGGDVAQDLFERGICLPSSSNLTEAEQDFVIETVRTASRGAQVRDGMVAGLAR